MCVWKHLAKLCWKRVWQHYTFSWKLELRLLIYLVFTSSLYRAVYFIKISLPSQMTFVKPNVYQPSKVPFYPTIRNTKEKAFLYLTWWSQYGTLTKIRTNQIKMFDSNFQMLCSLYIPYVILMSICEWCSYSQTLLSVGKSLRNKGTEETEEKKSFFWW